MSEKRFTLDDEENGLCRCILVDGEYIPTCEICDLLNEQQDIIKKQCNHKKAILDFLKFMRMDNPLMEIMVDEFLEEVYLRYGD